MRVAWSRRAAVGLAVAVLAGAASVAGQRPSVDTSMEGLVHEVRALRLAVERSGVLTAQAQMFLGRLQLQENRLATLGRQAQDARLRLQDAAARLSTEQFELSRMGKTLDEVASGDERRAVEEAIAERKQSIKQTQARVDQLRAEEVAASNALSSEQSRWTDINERLEALERTLATATQRDR